MARFTPAPTRSLGALISMTMMCCLALLPCCKLVAAVDTPVFNTTRQQLDLAEVTSALSNIEAYFNNTFLRKNNRSYTAVEWVRRRGVFQTALAAIKQSHDDFTAGNSTYWLKITPFTDMTPEEFKNSFTGLVPTRNSTNTSTANNTVTTRRQMRRQARRQALATAAAPVAVDWRSASFGSAVTSIKNQGSCDDCWAFSTTAAVETSAAVKSSTPAVSLSEMQVLNCAPTSGYCSNGNTLPGGFQYFQGPGVTTYANFPYTAGFGLASPNSGCTQPAPLTNISTYTPVFTVGPANLQTAAAITAVSVAICADTINNYGGGLMTSSGICAGCTTVDHAVTVVGYTTAPSGAGAFSDSTSNYWIVKNSWGTGWGDAGYAYFQMSGGFGSSSFNGPCQILQEPVYVPPTAVSVQSAAAPQQSPGPSGTNTGTTVNPPPPPAPSPPSPPGNGASPQLGASLLCLVAAMMAALMSSAALHSSC